MNKILRKLFRCIETDLNQYKMEMYTECEEYTWRPLANIGASADLSSLLAPSSGQCVI